MQNKKGLQTFTNRLASFILACQKIHNFNQILICSTINRLTNHEFPQPYYKLNKHTLYIPDNKPIVVSSIRAVLGLTMSVQTFYDLTTFPLQTMDITCSSTHSATQTWQCLRATYVLQLTALIVHQMQFIFVRSPTITHNLSQHYTHTYIAQQSVEAVLT